MIVGYRGYGMAPHWMGGIPAEGPGPVPPQLELRPAHRQTTSPNVFENLVLDLEAALAMGGWSLHREARGNRVVYRAGDRVVAEAVQVPGGFIGTINAMPVGRLHTEYAKREMQLQQRKMGFGSPGESGGGTVWGVVGTLIGVGVLGGLVYLGWRLGKAE